MEVTATKHNRLRVRKVSIVIFLAHLSGINNAHLEHMLQQLVPIVFFALNVPLAMHVTNLVLQKIQPVVMATATHVHRDTSASLLLQAHSPNAL
jgi:hypothetical protein